VPRILDFSDLLLMKGRMERTGRLEHAVTLICRKHGITYSRSFATIASACMVTEPPYYSMSYL